VERQLIDRLAEIWNDYLKLERMHPQEQAEFCWGVHYLQDKLFSRIGQRVSSSN
jgi:hypothetical protein